MLSLYRNAIDKNYLESEKIQFYLRVTIISLVIINLVYLRYFSQDMFLQENVKALFPYPVLALLISFIDFYLIYKHPYLFQKQRIILMSLFDVFATVGVMYVSGELSVYYPVLLLWFVIGYGMRYGVGIGYITYANVLLGWSVLLYFSDFWHQNLDMGFGWLIAYAVIPLYFFKLVKELHRNIFQLYKEVDDSKYKALHDPLTKLPNRIYFNDMLERYIQEYKKKGDKFALIFIDLDAFKAINDSFGHEIGDEVLIEVSKRIATLNSFISRLGGDEFVALVKFKSKDELDRKLKKLMKTLNKECLDDTIQLSASIGVALYPDDAQTMYDLKKRSDLAMYKAKAEGKNRYVYFSQMYGNIVADENSNNRSE